MKFIIGLTGSILFLVLVRLSVAVISKTANTDCWPIKPSQATGTVRCWSNGVVVYQRPIYHNGGVLCSAGGKEINLHTPDLCVIESTQSNAWAPPAKGDAK